MTESVLHQKYADLLALMATVVRSDSVCSQYVMPHRTNGVGHGHDGQPLNSPASTSPYAGGSTANLNTEIKLFRINKANNGVAPKCRVVIVGGIHGRELAPPTAACRFFTNLVLCYERKSPMKWDEFEYIADAEPNYDANGMYKSSSKKDSSPIKATYTPFTIPIEDINSYIENLDILFVPVANPDGRDYVLTDAPGASVNENNIRTMWRKNRENLLPIINGTAPNVYKERVNVATDKKIKDYVNYPVDTTNGILPANYPIGIDINRNADVAWKGFIYYKYDVLLKYQQAENTSPSSADLADYSSFRGHEPNSTPEVKNLIGLLELNDPTQPESTTNPRNYAGALYFLDMHQAEKLIYIPWNMTSFNLANNRNVPTHNYRNTKLDSNAGPDYRNMTNAAITDEGERNDNNYFEYYPVTNYKQLVTKEEKGKKTSKEGKTVSIFTLHNEVGKVVSEGILAATRGNNTKDKSLEQRSQYDVMEGYNPSTYAATGVITDYAFALNLQYSSISNSAGDTFTASSRVRTGPVVAMTIEFGDDVDGGVAPMDTYIDHPERGQNHYKKVEREIVGAIHAFLKQAVQSNSLVPNP